MTKRSEGLGRLAKAAAPTVVGLIGVVLLALPVRLLGGLVPMPAIPLIIVFFWAIYGPSYLPAFSVFAMGLVQDFLVGGPLGLWPAVYLFAQYVVLSQRGYFIGRDFHVVWIGFGFVAGAAALLVWLVTSVMHGGPLPVQWLAYQTAVTVAVYPAFSRMFGRLHRRVIVEPRA
jgi:rod shape-determining protein MreD